MRGPMKKAVTLILACLLLFSLTACTAGLGNTISDTVFLSRDSLYSLEVELTSGELNIYPTDGEPYVDYTIKTGGLVIGDPTVRVRQNGQKTTIDMDGFTVNFGGYFSCDMDVYIPRDAVRELSVEMTSGDTAISDLRLRELEISLTSGRVDAEHISADCLELVATSGSADISGSFDDISVDITSGNFEIATAILPSRIECEATSGDIDVLIPADSSGFALYYERTSGSISSSFSTSGSASERSGALLYGDGSCVIEVDITSGSVHIGKQ